MRPERANRVHEEGLMHFWAASSPVSCNLWHAALQVRAQTAQMRPGQGARRGGLRAAPQGLCSRCGPQPTAGPSR